jgi:ribonuclease HII
MNEFVIGIDEVGRGALAGPVVVAAVLIRRRYAPDRTTTPAVPLRDSKKLSARQREAWASVIAEDPAIDFAVARVYPRGIERMNISRAANLAAARAYRRLTLHRRLPTADTDRAAPRRRDSGRRGSRPSAHSRELADEKIASVRIFLDGGLFLGNGPQPTNARTIVKGDEKIPAVAMASIIAKVARDRFMVRLAKKYPQYGFAAHKGYGTARHYAALRKYGPSASHRRTFLSSSRRMLPTRDWAVFKTPRIFPSAHSVE